MKYGLIAAAVVLAIIAGAMFIPGGGDGGGGTDGTPPEVTPGPTEPPEITPGPTEPPEVTPGPTDPDDGGGSSEPMQVEYKGVSFTVPAGWEESQLDDGVSYTLWGDGYYASYMAYSIGSRDSFDADTYLNDLVEQYNYMSDAEVINAQTTSINGYPAAYLEIIYHYTDQPEAYEMIIVTSTPSTELVEISGSCPAERTDCRDELHSIADSLVIA